MRLKIFLAISLFLCLPLFVLGQDTTENKVSENTEISKTTKIDEFGDIFEAESFQKLKRFQSLIKKNKNSKAYIIYYSSFNDPLFRQTAYYIRRKTHEFDDFLTRNFS